MDGNDLIAPFVMKTYRMVDDPTTEKLITWGKANNSFVVVEPLGFSQRILPVYFKHHNFSSFVRQLNTYGFKKVDPDRWEFANEWFLRGQKHLLKNIIRRRHSKNPYSSHNKHADYDDDDEEMLVEIVRLKQEQRDMEIELEQMNKRIEATEKRPKQMMNFLNKVAEDPEILPRLVLEKEQIKRSYVEKKRRSMISSSSLSPLTSSSADAEVGLSSSISSPEVQFHESSPSPEPPSSSDRNLIFRELYNVTSNSFGPSFVADAGGISSASLKRSGCEIDNSDVGYFGRMVGKVEYNPPPYPFSLLGGGF